MQVALRREKENELLLNYETKILNKPKHCFVVANKCYVFELADVFVVRENLIQLLVSFSTG